jgi:flavin-binding protein dodecin
MKGDGMSVAKVVELTAESPNSFEEAIEAGIAKASQTLRNVKGAWIKEQKVVVENGKITEYRVDLKITFVLEG